MSSINPNNIDGTYPIAGQDNDSQGFRDNFTNIKNNFTFASTEISDLQNNAILKAPLSGTTLNNNLNNAQLIGAQISKFTQTRNPIPTTSGSITVNWSDAHFQTVSLSANATVTLGSWPTSGFWTDLVLDVTPTTNNVYLSLAGFTNPLVNATSIQGFTGNTIAFPSGNVTYRFEFSTYDGGTTVSVRDLFRNYDAAIDFSQLNVSGNVLAQGAVFNSATVNGNLNVSGNVLSAGAVHNALTVNGDTVLTGNVVRAGGQVDTGYQYYAPTGNTAITANVNVSRVILDPTADAFGIVFTLPAGNVNAKIITLSSTANIAGLQPVGSYGTTVVPSVNVAMPKGTSIQFFYQANESKWYKIG